MLEQNTNRIFENCNRLIIKVGTTTLTHSNGKLNLSRINKLAWVLSDLKNQNKEIILVTSGAVAVGVDRIGLTERPKDMVGKQAASAVGQAALMQIYEKFFGEYNQKVAQILLTKDVVKDKIKKQNAQNTFFKLLEFGVIPIVNENDSISIEELNSSFSDNDNLSSYVACLTNSDLLIILSDIDGFYDKDPNLSSDAKIIPVVEEINEKIMNLAGDSQSGLGTGGMASKLVAAKRAAKSGIKTVIASGSDPEIIFKILKGEEIGTYFKPNIRS